PMRGRLERRTWQYDPTLYAPARYRRACSYDAFVPDPIAGFAEPLGSETAAAVSDAEMAIHSLNSRARPALAPLARLLLRTESIASSKVEGLQVDARDLARAEARIETGGKAGPTAKEILANVDAMELAVDEASTTSGVTIDEIIAIHRALMAGAPNSQVAGVVRTQQTWIGGNDYNPCGAAFVCPPNGHVRRLLTDLCAAVVEDGLPPLVQAALVHAQFETIHPFLDGNGRTGRALVHVVLRRRGLTPAYVPPISVILAMNRSRYITGLTRFRDGDVDGWLTGFAVAAAQAAGLAEAYLASVEQLQARWREQLRSAIDTRSDAAVWRVIDALPAHPVITLPVAVAATERTKAVVNQALGQLERAGVLIRLSQGERNRTWEASGLLDLLTDLEAGRPPKFDGIDPSSVGSAT
ncbi:MAG: Fic family protein, partial [Actinomycetia bacterium]|nr:Fic family protein [Actinomycetes bacterium]